MIGGVDIKIPTRGGRAALEASVRVIGSHWPRAIFQNAENGERYDGFGAISFDRLKEIFVYRDEAARDLWEVEGAVPEATNLMIYLIVDDLGLFVVMCDDTTEEIRGVLDAIKACLSDDNMGGPA